MASYTDIIPKFNPYISQLPIEAMTSVGMEKQRRYDEGLQKIQTNIDNIAGLDVIRNVDKNYLQSKLNDLGSRLKTVAAGDFSNYQLVNSVGGMAKQIGKDTNVQNAVGSTARYRKSLAEKEALTKEGKASANRDFDFSRGVNEWIESDDLTKSYNGQYKAHIDVNKKVFETLKSLNPNLKESDMPYQISKNGVIDWNNFAAIMQRSSTKEISEGQIRTAVNAVLDSNDLDELASQGRYAYKDVSTEKLSQAALEDFNKTDKEYKRKLVELKARLLSTTDLAKQEEINGYIDYYKNQVGDVEEKIPSKLANSYKETLELIPQNPDAARSQIYKRNWLDQIGNAFAYRELKDEVLASPGRADYWKAQDFGMESLKISLGEKWNKINNELKQRAQTLAEWEANQKYPVTSPVGWVTSGDPTTDAVTAYDNFTTYGTGIKTQNEAILNDLTKKDSSFFVKADPKAILKNIEDFKTGKYVPKSQSERDKFIKYIENSNNLSTQEALRDKIQDESYREITGNKESYSQALNKQLSSLNGLKVLLPNGTYTSFSPRELHDFLRKEKYSAVGKASDVQVDINPEDLTEREKLLYSKVKARYGKVGVRSTGNADTDNILDRITPIAAKNRGLMDKVHELTAKKLMPITGEFVTQQTGLRFKDNTDKGNFVSDLTNIVQADLQQNVAGKNYNPEDILESFGKKTVDNLEFQVKRKGANVIVQVTDLSTQKTSDIPVTEDWVSKNNNLGNKFLNKGLDIADSFLRNYGTTNVFKDFKHAHLPAGTLGGQTSTGLRTVNLPVAIDFEKDGNEINPIFRMKTKTGFLNLPLPINVDPEEFKVGYARTLTDDKILKLFKTRYPNIEELIEK